MNPHRTLVFSPAFGHPRKSLSGLQIDRWSIPKTSNRMGGRTAPRSERETRSTFRDKEA